MQPYYTPSLPNASGIYCITCTVTGKMYVGSAINLRQRRKSHFGDLQRNRHRNTKLQRAWAKYGPQSFIFEVLELVLISELLTAREQYWFDTLQPFGNKGFNLDRVAGSSLGRKPTPGTIEKISAANRGKPSKRIGYKQPSEAVERQRRALLGRKQTEEQIRKAAEARIGKKRSPETREKMRLAALGHAPTRVRTFIVTSPDGVETVVNNLAGFCRDRNISSSTLVQVARGNRAQHKGWKARYA